MLLMGMALGAVMGSFCCLPEGAAFHRHAGGYVVAVACAFSSAMMPFPSTIPSTASGLTRVLIRAERPDHAAGRVHNVHDPASFLVLFVAALVAQFTRYGGRCTPLAATNSRRG